MDLTRERCAVMENEGDHYTGGLHRGSILQCHVQMKQKYHGPCTSR